MSALRRAGFFLATAGFLVVLLPLSANAKVDTSADAKCKPVIKECGCGQILNSEKKCVGAGSAANMHNCACKSDIKPAGGFCQAENDCKGTWFVDQNGKRQEIDPNASDANVQKQVSFLPNMSESPQSGGGTPPQIPQGPTSEDIGGEPSGQTPPDPADSRPPLFKAAETSAQMPEELKFEDPQFKSLDPQDIKHLEGAPPGAVQGDKNTLAQQPFGEGTFSQSFDPEGLGSCTGLWDCTVQSVQKGFQDLMSGVGLGPQSQGIGINGNREIDLIDFYNTAREKFANSDLIGRANDLKMPDRVKKELFPNGGTADEWARFATQLCMQESSCHVGAVNSDGSIRKFSSTPSGEQSYGPLQFNKGERGLETWADVNSPARNIDALINVAQTNDLQNYFGSIYRPNEILSRSGWFQSAVASQVTTNSSIAWNGSIGNTSPLSNAVIATAGWEGGSMPSPVRVASLDSVSPSGASPRTTVLNTSENTVFDTSFRPLQTPPILIGRPAESRISGSPSVATYVPSNPASVPPILQSRGGSSVAQNSGDIGANIPKPVYSPILSPPPRGPSTDLTTSGGVPNVLLSRSPPSWWERATKAASNAVSNAWNRLLGTSPESPPGLASGGGETTRQSVAQSTGGKTDNYKAPGGGAITQSSQRAPETRVQGGLSTANTSPPSGGAITQVSQRAPGTRVQGGLSTANTAPQSGGAITQRSQGAPSAKPYFDENGKLVVSDVPTDYSRFQSDRPLKPNGLNDTMVIVHGDISTCAAVDRSYHGCIAQDGTFYQFRPFDQIAPHAASDNSKTSGIVLEGVDSIGEGSEAKQPPSEAQLNSLAKVLYAKDAATGEGVQTPFYRHPDTAQGQGHKCDCEGGTPETDAYVRSLVAQYRSGEKSLTGTTQIVAKSKSQDVAIASPSSVKVATRDKSVPASGGLGTKVARYLSSPDPPPVPLPKPQRVASLGGSASPSGASPPATTLNTGTNVIGIDTSIRPVETPPTLIGRPAKSRISGSPSVVTYVPTESTNIPRVLRSGGAPPTTNISGSPSVTTYVPTQSTNIPQVLQSGGSRRATVLGSDANTIRPQQTPSILYAEYGRLSLSQSQAPQIPSSDASSPGLLSTVRNWAGDTWSRITGGTPLAEMPTTELFDVKPKTLKASDQIETIASSPPSGPTLTDQAPRTALSDVGPREAVRARSETVLGSSENIGVPEGGAITQKSQGAPPAKSVSLDQIGSPSPGQGDKNGNGTLGDIGVEVRNTQRALNAILDKPIAEPGQPGSPGNETNEFGPKTLAGVKAFQKANGLTPDGIVGPQTRAALNKAIEARNSAVPPPETTAGGKSGRPQANTTPGGGSKSNTIYDPALTQRNQVPGGGSSKNILDTAFRHPDEKTGILAGKSPSPSESSAASPAVQPSASVPPTPVQKSTVVSPQPAAELGQTPPPLVQQPAAATGPEAQQQRGTEVAPTTQAIDNLEGRLKTAIARSKEGYKNSETARAAAIDFNQDIKKLAKAVTEGPGISDSARNKIIKAVKKIEANTGTLNAALSSPYTWAPAHNIFDEAAFTARMATIARANRSLVNSIVGQARKSVNTYVNSQ